MSYPSPQGHAKTIAIIGGGTGGLGALKALLDVPAEYRQDWHIDLYEQRSNIGGIWHPENPGDVVPEDGLPETPVYPALKLNTVHPTITFPKFPFPPETPLLPHYSYLAQYHIDFAKEFNLIPHIHVRHTAVAADYDQQIQKWTITLRHPTGTVTHQYDHLIIGSGHNHYPRLPSWYTSKEIWVKNGRRQNGQGEERQIIHSIRYRNPEDVAGHTVIVVGFGASGWDIATQTVQHAKKVYHSYDPTTRKMPIPPVKGTTQIPIISYLSTKEMIIPSRDAPSKLTTNLSLIRPLHKQVFAIDSRIPKNALAFIGLPVPIANGVSSYIQGLYVAHGLVDEKVVPDLDEALDELEADEELVREGGHDPLVVGHRFFGDNVAADYQDDFLTTLHSKSQTPLPSFLTSKIPNPNNPSEEIYKPYTDSWRRFARSPANFMTITKGWKNIVEHGREAEYVKGVHTEEGWEKVIYAVWEFGKKLIEEEEKLVQQQQGCSLGLESLGNGSPSKEILAETITHDVVLKEEVGGSGWWPRWWLRRVSS